LTATQREIIEEVARGVGLANASSMFGNNGLNGTKLRLGRISQCFIGFLQFLICVF
jgi:hypothetical protein